MPDAIPEGSRLDMTTEFPYDLPALPGRWQWRTFNHNSFGKVNVYFGHDVHDVGGWLGEIDNFQGGDGSTIWELHVREIVDAPHTQHGSLPAAEPETTAQFPSLEAAIDTVPEHLETFYDAGVPTVEVRRDDLEDALDLIDWREPHLPLERLQEALDDA